MVMSQESINRFNDDVLEAERAGVESVAKLCKADFQSSNQEDLWKFGEHEGWTCSGLRQVSNQLKDYGDGLPRGMNQLDAPDAKTCLGKALDARSKATESPTPLNPHHVLSHIHHALNRPAVKARGAESRPRGLLRFCTM